MNDGQSPIRTSAETDKIDAAMAAAQVELENPIKGRTADLKGVSKTSGKEYSIGYSYADIADILADCRPVIAGKGIAIYQVPIIREGFMMIVTRLAHAGQWIEGDYPVCKIGGDHQDMGKAMTYARRYGLGAMIGIAPEKDTDGAGAAPAGAPENKRDPRGDRSPDGLKVTAAKSAMLTQCNTPAELVAWGKANEEAINALPGDYRAEVSGFYKHRLKVLKEDEAEREKARTSDDPFDDPIPFGNGESEQ